MALTATGIGSGLDINTIVNVLVDAEKVPKEALFNKAERTIDAKVSAMGTLKSSLSTFQDALSKLTDSGNLNQRTVDTGDNNYFGATADKNAQPGSYNIRVEQLAQAHKVAGAYTADSSLPVGEGSLDLTVNGNSFNVVVGATDSLDTIAKNINDATDNAGITATIVTSDSGSRLVLTSNTEGPANSISVAATDIIGTGLNDMFGGVNLQQVQTAQSSIIHIDGEQLTSETNEVTNAIAGITLNLTEADNSQTNILSIAQDDAAVKEVVEGFVDSYNSLMESIDKLSVYDADTDTAAALQGDSMLRSIESQLRSIASERITVGSDSIALYDIGIEADRYGKLSVDSTKLDDMIANNMDKVEGLFATDVSGIANRFDNMVDGYVKTSGLISSRTNTYTSDKHRLDDQREAFSLKMELLESRLFKQFNAMDLIVANLNAQSASIVSGLNSLPGAVSNQD